MYECVADGSIKLMQAYVDDDVKENFFCCAWSYDSASGQPLLAAAGAKGVIRIISPRSLIDIKVRLSVSFFFRKVCSRWIYFFLFFSV